MIEDKIKAREWRCGKFIVGIVAIETHGGWKAYIGTGRGRDEETDAIEITTWGAKLLENEARAFFPQFKDETYVE